MRILSPPPRVVRGILSRKHLAQGWNIVSCYAALGVAVIAAAAAAAGRRERGRRCGQSREETVAKVQARHMKA